MLTRILVVVIIQFHFANMAYAGMMQSASSYLDYAVNGKCDMQSTAVRELAESARSCTNHHSLPGLEDLSKIRRATEDGYFAQLAAGRAHDLECDRDQLRELPPQLRRKFAEKIASDIASLKDIGGEIHDAEAQAKSEAESLLRTAGPAGKETAEKVKQIYAKVERLKFEQQTRASKIPLSRFPQIQNIIARGVQAQGPLSGQTELETAVLSAMSKQAEELDEEAKVFEAGAKAKEPTSILSSDHLNSLAKDTRLIQEVAGADPKEADTYAMIACEANARWGAGRDRLDATLAVGSLFVSGGGFAFVRTLTYLRNTGRLISAVRAQRLAQLVPKIRHIGFELDMAALSSNIERKCFGQGGGAKFAPRETGECSAEALVKEASNTDCVADLTLNALGFGAYLKTGRATGKGQEAVWANRAAGNFKGAAENERLIVDTLQKGEVRGVTETGNSATGARFVKFSNGMQGVFKTQDYKKEIAAYAVDRELQAELVPVTVERTVNGTPGSIQARVGDLEGRLLADRDQIPDKIRVFDLLVGNSDRELERNWLRTKSGHEVAIDHDVRSFIASDSEIQIPEKRTQFLRLEKMAANIRQEAKGSASAEQKDEIARGFYEYRFLRSQYKLVEKLKSVGPERWKRVLSPYLTQEQIDAFIKRREDILAVYDRFK